MNTWTRRHFLKAAGLGAGASALSTLLPGLDPHAMAMAPTGARAKRLILFCHGNGSLLEDWRPKTRHRTSWQAHTILNPLTESRKDSPGWRDQMLLLDGIDNVAGHKKDPKVSGHSSAVSLWTANYPLEGKIRSRRAANASIETLIGEHIAKTADVIFPYLHFGIGEHPFHEGYHWFYQKADTPHYVEHDPRAAFDRIFGTMGGDDREKREISTRRKSVLDLVAGDISRIQNSIQGEQRERLERHLGAIRALEKRLGEFDQMKQCALPGKPERFDEKRQMSQGRQDHEIYIDAQIDMIVASLQCDLTRVVGLSWGTESGENYGKFIEGYDDAVQKCVKDGDGGRCANKIHRLSHYSHENEQARNFIRNFNRSHASTLRKLIDKLAKAPDPTDPEGKDSLMDGTIILWGTALSHGFSHSGRNAPHVIIEGGGSPYFRLGEYHRWGDYDDWGRSYQNPGGQQNNKLLTSLAHAYGLGISSFGDRDVLGDLDAQIAR